jgi:hypothetical protein
VRVHGDVWIVRGARIRVWWVYKSRVVGCRVSINPEFPSSRKKDVKGAVAVNSESCLGVRFGT